MRLGLAVPQAGSHVTVDLVRRFAQDADALGYDSLWVQERLLRPLAPATKYAGVAATTPAEYGSVWSALELMAALAVWTNTVRIGSSVIVAGYHNPVHLAKGLATVDQLSDGRVVAGLGVGWSDEEHQVSGVDARTRGRRCDDFIPALLACWGPNPVEYHGPWFDIPASEIGPKPVQRPHPPLVLGMWSQAGRLRTARFGDGWNPSGQPLPWISSKLIEMNAARAGEQSPLETYQRLFFQSPVRPQLSFSLDQMAEEVRACKEAGITEVLLDTALWAELRTVEDLIGVPGRLRPLLAIAKDD